MLADNSRYTVDIDGIGILSTTSQTDDSKFASNYVPLSAESFAFVDGFGFVHVGNFDSRCKCAVRFGNNFEFKHADDDSAIMVIANYSKNMLTIAGMLYYVSRDQQVVCIDIADSIRRIGLEMASI